MNYECKRFSLPRSCLELIQVDCGWLRAREAGGRMELCLAPRKLQNLLSLALRYELLLRIINTSNENVIMQVY